MIAFSVSKEKENSYPFNFFFQVSFILLKKNSSGKNVGFGVIFFLKHVYKTLHVLKAIRLWATYNILRTSNYNILTARDIMIC